MAFILRSCHFRSSKDCAEIVPNSNPIALRRFFLPRSLREHCFLGLAIRLRSTRSDAWKPEELQGAVEFVRCAVVFTSRIGISDGRQLQHA